MDEAHSISEDERDHKNDMALIKRAGAVLPNLTHLSTRYYPPHYSQFFSSANGCKVIDVDGNEFIDYMCSFGPILLGHQHAIVEKAAADQRQYGDCLPGPTERMVELAELLVSLTPFATWAMFQKNGSDATSLCVRLARAHTRKRYILRAGKSYHGASHMWMEGIGVLPEEQAFQLSYDWNDLDSVRQCLKKAGADLAAIIAPAFKWDLFEELEIPTSEFAQGLRDICDEANAILILDDVRSCMRLDPKGSWNTLAPGVFPDLTAYCKGIANGYPLAAVLGCEKIRKVAARVPSTGSFWCNAVPFAAAIATIKVALAEDVVSLMVAAGLRLRRGLQAQAQQYNLNIICSGPPQMPFLTFVADSKSAGSSTDPKSWPRISLWCSECAIRGVWFHPFHNNFISAAHTAEVIDSTLLVTDKAFRSVRMRFGPDEAHASQKKSHVSSL